MNLRLYNYALKLRPPPPQTNSINEGKKLQTIVKSGSPRIPVAYPPPSSTTDGGIGFKHTGGESQSCYIRYHHGWVHSVIFRLISVELQSLQFNLPKSKSLSYYIFSFFFFFCNRESDDRERACASSLHRAHRISICSSNKCPRTITTSFYFINPEEQRSVLLATCYICEGGQRTHTHTHIHSYSAPKIPASNKTRGSPFKSPNPNAFWGSLRASCRFLAGLYGTIFVFTEKKRKSYHFNPSIPMCQFLLRPPKSLTTQAA